jgi:hypothetical protein
LKSEITIFCLRRSFETGFSGPGGVAQLLLMGLVFLLSACATNTTVTVTGDKHQAAVVSCDVQFFSHGKPATAYETLARIESHIQKNMFFGKAAKLEDDAYAELRVKSCSVGGNGVVIDDYVESTAAEFSHVHVWASAIRLK